jgi:hypothetical protein
LGLSPTGSHEGLGVHQDQSSAHNRAEGNRTWLPQPHSGEEGTVAEAEMLAAEVQSARLTTGAAFRRAVTRGPQWALATTLALDD